MKTDANSGLRAAVRQFDKHNPKVFRKDGSVRFRAYAIWKKPGEKPYREDDLYAVWEARLNDSTPESVILEQPDGKGGWEPCYQFDHDVGLRFSYDQNTNELVLWNAKNGMEIRIGYNLSVLELIALQKTVN